MATALTSSPVTAAGAQSRKSFLIDSLLQRKLKTEVSTASELTEDETDSDEKKVASPCDSEDALRGETEPEEEPESPASSTATLPSPSPLSQQALLSTFSKLMAANSMQNMLMAHSNHEYAARFRMLNLNAMAPSLAAFGNPQLGKQLLPAFVNGMIRPESTVTAGRLPLSSSISALNKFISSGSLAAAAAGAGARTTASASAPANPTIRSSNVKKYRCDICDKTFSRSNTLITHKRIHTGEKPFRCEHCGRAFRQPGNLTRHRLTHTTEKPFVCSECGKAFNRASNLHTHMRTHYASTARMQCGESR